MFPHEDSEACAGSLAWGDLLKLAKRLEIALDSGSGAASSRDVERTFENDDNDDVGDPSMACG